MTSQASSPENVRSSPSKPLRQLWDFVKKHPDIILLIVSIILIFGAVRLVKSIIDDTFKRQFSCAFVVDRTLLGSEPGKGDFSFCEGVGFTIPGITLINETDIGPFTIPYIGFHDIKITILPGLKPIDIPLRAARLFVARSIVITFAVISVVLTFIAVRIKAFVQALMTPKGRRKILENISIYLIIFAVISGLFYFSIVANH